VNERIRLLAKEAEFSEVDLHIQGDNFQRFAELIVRECAQKLENDGMVEVAMEIKQHFGVES